MASSIHAVTACSLVRNACRLRPRLIPISTALSSNMQVYHKHRRCTTSRGNIRLFSSAPQLDQSCTKVSPDKAVTEKDDSTTPGRFRDVSK